MRTVASRSKTTPKPQTAARAAAVKSEETKAGAAKKTTARTNAAKTAAVKDASARNNTSKATAKKTTARTSAAKTAAAKSAAAKAAETKAAKAAAAKAAKEHAQRAAEEQAQRAAEESQGAAVIADDAVPTVEAVIAPVEPETPPAPEPAPPVVPEEDPAPEPQPEPVPEPEPEPVSELEASLEPESSSEPEPEPAAQAESAPDPAAATEAVVTDVPAATASDAIVIRGLVKDFGDQRAVNGIDLTVPAGTFYGIVGPNGAGKTTTLSILAGLLRADAGEVEVCGIDQATDPLGAKRVMGVLPDRLRTFDRLTGRQLLHYYGLLRGLSADVIEKRSADLMRAFDLSGAVGRVVSDYSAGMTKKIMLAGAMIHSPRVLVLDEPFESVDPVSSAVILDILRAYVDHGGTVILSSHGMDLVERVCSRIAIIVGGDVLAEGTIDEVRAGQTLESRFVELSGGASEVEGLEWLHTFSD